MGWQVPWLQCPECLASYYLNLGYMKLEDIDVVECPTCRRMVKPMVSEGDPNKTLPTNIAQAILDEYRRARMKFPAMRGPHEGYAVILEELDEAWDEIKANNIEKARKEMLQVAAMALAFLVEVK